MWERWAVPTCQVLGHYFFFREVSFLSIRTDRTGLGIGMDEEIVGSVCLGKSCAPLHPGRPLLLGRSTQELSVSWDVMGMGLWLYGEPGRESLYKKPVFWFLLLAKDR